MNTLPLRESYAYCHELMHTAARNFYFGMRLLPETKRQAMHALYSYMRLVDDITDNTPAANDLSAPASKIDSRRQQLDQWRTDTHRALAGDTGGHPIWPAFHDMVRRFQIPAKVFDDAIDGQLQDLTQNRYATFTDLYDYCYRVASTVGIAAVHIWGFRSDHAVQHAEERGIALQLTNILRDLRDDAARGRRYLPADDCARFGCTHWNAAVGGAIPAGFDDLLQFQTARARAYYEQSSPLEELVNADARPTLQIMTTIYRRILDRIAASPRLVLVRRVGLSTVEKLSLVVRHAWRSQIDSLEGNF